MLWTRKDLGDPIADISVSYSPTDEVRFRYNLHHIIFYETMVI